MSPNWNRSYWICPLTNCFHDLLIVLDCSYSATIGKILQSEQWAIIASTTSENRTIRDENQTSDVHDEFSYSTETQSNYSNISYATKFGRRIFSIFEASDQSSKLTLSAFFRHINESPRCYLSPSAFIPKTMSNIPISHWFGSQNKHFGIPAFYKDDENNHTCRDMHFDQNEEIEDEDYISNNFKKITAAIKVIGERLGAKNIEKYFNGIFVFYPSSEYKRVLIILGKSLGMIAVNIFLIYYLFTRSFMSLVQKLWWKRFKSILMKIFQSENHKNYWIFD